jgi:hypothetical protein
MKKINNLLPQVGLGAVLALFLLSGSAQAQVRLGDNLGNHKATKALDMNAKNIDNIGSVQYGVLDLSATPTVAAATIGANAAATVDIYSAIAVSVSGAGDNILLAAPTAATPGRIVSVINKGALFFTLNTELIPVMPGASIALIWDGAKWIENGGSKLVSLSSISAAKAINTIDNTNFAQLWSWTTATTQNPFSMTAAALTTGSLFTLNTGASPLTTGSAVNVTGAVAATTTNGLFYLANTAASSTGTVARIAANSTAGTGLTVLANGNVGVGTAAPKATLHNAGSTILGAKTTDVSLVNGTELLVADVDAYTVFNCDATVANLTLTLPNPTDATAGHIISVINKSVLTNSFKVLGVVIPKGSSKTLVWDGAKWVGEASNTMGKAIVTITAATAGTINDALDNSAVALGGSANTSYTFDLTVTGVETDDVVVINYAAADYIVTKWLAPGVLTADVMVGQNNGVMVSSAVATATNTVRVTLSNFAANSKPAVEGLKLSVGFNH